MGWLEEQREQRRRDDAARAEQVRRDALAAAQVQQMQAHTQVEMWQAREAQRAEQRRLDRADRLAERAASRDRRRAVWTRLRMWAVAHVVDLLIYPLAVVSAVMAIPAMAAFGHDVYGTAAGYALPIITELGMWAFAVAVHIARRRTDHDGVERSVWALQLGTWTFAAVAAGLNFLHGLTPPETMPEAGVTSPQGVSAGVVMAVASVAGVVAHQLVTAAPRRGRVERDAARVERQAIAKVTRARRAAVRSAVAEIDEEGQARLWFAAGHFRLTRSRFAPWRRSRLASVALPGLAVTPAIEDGWDEIDRELAVLLATTDPRTGARPDPTTGSAGPTGPKSGGGVGTLDRDFDTPDNPTTAGRESGQVGDHPDSSTQPARQERPARKSSSTPARKPSKKSSSMPRSTSRSASRSIEELKAALRAAIDADPTSIDPTSAESIRRALHCSPARARALRDSYQSTDSGDRSKGDRP